LEHQSKEHNHPHEHDLKKSGRSKIHVVFGLTVGFMFVEAFGGWWTGSLALLSDAGHMFTDAAALGLAMLAFYLSSMPPSPQRSFGFHRAEIMAAMINGLVLFGIAALIVKEGISRLSEPRHINGPVMLGIAAGGLLVNIVAGYILMGGDRSNLNIRAALFHVAGDALGSVGAIAAAIIILLTGLAKADPIASFVIAAIIVLGALKLVSDATHIFLEGTPRHIELTEVEKTILSHPSVTFVHDLHVWTITSGFVSLSAHVGISCDGEKQPSISDTDVILQELGELLRKRFNIGHYTIQIEREICTSDSCQTCSES